MRRLLRRLPVLLALAASLLLPLGLGGCIQSERVVLTPYLGAPPRTSPQPEWRRIPPDPGEPPKEEGAVRP